MFIKIILFYFAFSVIRNLFKGFTQVKNSQNAYKGQFNTNSETARANSSDKKSAKQEDVVEAEFRRL